MKMIDKMNKKLERLEAEMLQLFGLKANPHLAHGGTPFITDNSKGRQSMRAREKLEQRRQSKNEQIVEQKAKIERRKKKDEISRYRTSNVNLVNETLPAFLLDLLKTGELIQWRRHPHMFFVKGVNRARIIYDKKINNIWFRYYDEIDCNESRKVFRDLALKIFNHLDELNNP